MKKLEIKPLYCGTLFALYLLSQFLPATVKANSATFRLDTVDYFMILSAKWALYLILGILLVLTLLSFSFFRKFAPFLATALLCAFVVVVFSYTQWNYLSIAYKYGYWVTFTVGLLFGISLLLYSLQKVRKA